jgi:molecular chaperone DnaK (HSP70)
MLADGFIAKEGINPRNDPFAFEKLKVAAEAAKKSLSVEDEVEIRIPDVLVGEDGEMRSLEHTITSEEFGALVQDLVQRTFKVCDEAMQQAGMTVRDLDGIILVGGPTRLPIVRDAVKTYFQQDAKTDVDPDEVVAMGAAIHAASLVSSDKESVLLDVTPLDLRIGVAGGQSEAVIERNTPVPIEQSRSFSPFQDHQKSVTLKVYQGDSRQADENELLGQFEFSGFTPGLRSETAIDVCFEINADGIVNVIARDPESGEEASVEITLSSGLTDEDMGEILSRDRTADVKLTGLETEIGPDDLASPTIGTEVIESDELVLITDDEIDEIEDLDSLSEEELCVIASELDDDPNAISIGDVSEFSDEAVLLDDALEPESPNPTIGKVSLKTVAVSAELPTAPGAEIEASADADADELELTKDDLFDLADDVCLSVDPEEKEEG